MIVSDVAAPVGSGRYRLVDRLGSGGMAVVYRAWDERLRVWRAVKVLGPAAAVNAALRARFEREAQTMARLRHRNVLVVYDIGFDCDRPFMVMDLVGGSIHDVVARSGPLSPRLACDIVCAVLDALDLAHREGVVHRDVKPANILLEADGTPLISDFGIAHLHADGMTRDGAVVGTRGFMAPEQHGGAATVDGRADVYAAGATLHALLTGEGPPDADPAEDSLQSVPSALVGPISRAMARRPEDRFPTAGAFRQALLEIRSGLPTDPRGMPDFAAHARPSGEPPPPSGAPPLASGAPSGAPRSTGSSASGAPASSLPSSATWIGGETPVPAPSAVTPPAPRRVSPGALVGLSAVGIAAIAIVAAWNRPAVPEAADTAPWRVDRLTALNPDQSPHQLAAAPDGTLYYLAGDSLWRMEPGGVPERLPIALPGGSFDVMPDETRLIVSDGASDETKQLYTVDLATGERIPLGRVGVDPRVSPDGLRVAYVHKSGPISGRVMIAALSGGEAATMSGVGGGGWARLLAWSPDGKRLAVGSFAAGNGLLELVDPDSGAVREIYRADRLWLPGGSVAFAWRDDDHLLVQVRGAADDASEVLEIGVDASSEVEPRVIAALPVSGGEGAVRSGRSVVFLATTRAQDVWVGAVGDDGAVAEPRRLSPDDRPEALVGWSGDAVAYRNVWGTEALVLHRPDAEYGDIVMPAASAWLTVLSDRALLFPEGAPPVVVPFGQPMPDLVGPLIQVRCGSGVCVTARPVGDYLTWSTVDPVTGAVSEPFAQLESVGGQLRSSISLDGSEILVTRNLEWTRRHPVGPGDWSPIEMPPGFQVQYAAAGLGGTIWATGGSEDFWGLTRFSPESGWSEAVFAKAWVSNPKPSPDGRYVAFDQTSFDADLWSITPP